MDFLATLFKLLQLSMLLIWAPVAFLTHMLLLLLHIFKEPQLLLTDLRGSVCIVTGSNCGIGQRTATALLKCGAHVVFACRSERRAKKAMEAAVDEAKRGNHKEWAAECSASFSEIDLSSVISVRNFVQRCHRDFPGGIDVCVLNAGLNTGGITVDGLDQRWQVNYLMHFLIAKELFPLLCRSRRGARVVCLSSVMHWFGSPTRFANSMQPGSNHSGGVYADSKLAMNYLAFEMQRRFDEYYRRQRQEEEEEEEETRHAAISVNPGAVASDIWRGVPALLRRFAFDPLMALVFLNTDEGCATSVHAVTHQLWSPRDVLSSSSPSPLSLPQMLLSFPPYLVPYWVPFGFSLPCECIGPFSGVRRARQNFPQSIEVTSKIASDLWQRSTTAVNEMIMHAAAKGGENEGSSQDDTHVAQDSNSSSGGFAGETDPTRAALLSTADNRRSTRGNERGKTRSKGRH